jgi:hypothetical protein
MRYPASEKLEIIRLVERSHQPARRTLTLGSPRSTALPLQVDFALICLAQLQTSIRRHPVIGAPKWGIRSRMPLQLVGHEGLDNSQARCAPVRPRLKKGDMVVAQGQE